MRSDELKPEFGIEWAKDKVPELSTKQMIEVDRAMIEEYSITLIQMMENAGRNLAHLSRARFLQDDPRGKRVVVLAGSGGNGGGALVCARRLKNWGAEVTVFLSKPREAYRGVPEHQLNILHQMNLPIFFNDTQALLSDEPDLIIDGLIGYSLSGAPRGQIAKLIRWANHNAAPVLSLDTPSGLDVTSGEQFDPVIEAAATMTLALPKKGLTLAKTITGELYLADISVPPELYSKYLGIEIANLFATGEIIRLV